MAAGVRVPLKPQVTHSPPEYIFPHTCGGFFVAVRAAELYWMF